MAPRCVRCTTARAGRPQQSFAENRCGTGCSRRQQILLMQSSRHRLREPGKSPGLKNRQKPTMKKLLTHGIAYALVCALAHPPLALAQTANNPPAASTPSAPAEKIFNQEELEQMLAPVALYPDALL